MRRAKKTTQDFALDDDPLWYKNAVIYELHVRAFSDGNADGIGDFQGLTEKLDYLYDLGVTALWLLPFYPSPLKDDGYDIASYTEIHPDYGTLKDFKIFLTEAHRRGAKVEVILDKSNRTDRYSAATFMQNYGIPTFIDDRHAIAHNKIIIIDGRTVVTGSFNFTKQAEESNAENLLVIEDVALAAKYTQNWKAHLAHSKPYERQEKAAPRRTLRDIE